MKKTIAIAIIPTVAVFSVACANNTTTNTANTISNQNTANANSGRSDSMREGEHRGNMNGNHSKMGNRQMH